MLALSSLSRRALVAAAAVAALTPEVEARKRKKPPLAFAAGTLVDALPNGTAFTWEFRGSVTHPASGTTTTMRVSVTVAAKATADQARKKIVAGVRARAETVLLGLGQDVPQDRIAVTLL